MRLAVEHKSKVYLMEYTNSWDCEKCDIHIDNNCNNVCYDEVTAELCRAMSHAEKPVTFRRVNNG